jgi:hypothetical protein
LSNIGGLFYYCPDKDSREKAFFLLNSSETFLWDVHYRAKDFYESVCKSKEKKYKNSDLLLFGDEPFVIYA